MARTQTPGAKLKAPAPTPRDLDLLVIGSGPAGQKAAIQAAKLGKRVAVIERRHMVGGVCTNTGTLPSKTLREAVVYLTGMSQKQLYGQSYQVKDDITIEDLLLAHAGRHPARGRRGAKPAGAQPRADAARRRALRRPAHGRA